MKKVTGNTNQDEAQRLRTVGPKIADLLTEIEKEPVPERLMDLALELQRALAEKLGNED
ncbi:hypothetical protein MUU53_05205 [Rhizobium lemnae]|uniref:Anti-sigma factor NepR domain-containing protein n=1 Tax=Rhizobium lemnae TaxID=1214924 RepID=A0ABV8E353_9HYPH|nr:hypothetical protein [Rhizobium lemnae]MCJ8507308.1 hypothetical protein [Rhizobium lemnae]